MVSSCTFFLVEVLTGGCAVIQAPLFREVQHRVMALIRDKIIVGHNLWQFLSASNGTF